MNAIEELLRHFMIIDNRSVTYIPHSWKIWWEESLARAVFHQTKIRQIVCPLQICISFTALFDTRCLFWIGPTDVQRLVEFGW